MTKLDVAKKWVDIIMKCVTSVSYSILINVIPQNPFLPSRGIREGDPLSPYLFIFCAEVPSKLIQKAESRAAITGVPIGRSAKHKEAKDLIIAVAGIKSSQSYDRYPGLPTQIVRGKISNCKLKHLSQAGKEILIKVVLEAIPTYSMGVFKLPKPIVEELLKQID
ncbi:uncharacterized protein LOC121249391 [Juglans microcarpa x Juglans regia]|uniref:uncharacterized protein LOC121249391 n=1 Tax=Juglans microcarpa x Juglans regia TaxID=2249226 RepID=UPI001B7E4312|nr:uncharacterized protein LOC121249391 [Juglans microcarpa x Juglans regia]